MLINASMGRFEVYVVSFIINLLVFIVSRVFNLLDIANILNFISFTAALLYFTFSIGTEPKQNAMSIPEVHNYYKSRQNMYGSFIGAQFVVLSFVFFVLSFLFYVDLSLSIMIVWLISIPSTYLLIKFNIDNVWNEKFVDYVFTVLKTKDKKELLPIINAVIDSKGNYKSLENKQLDKELFDEVKSIYIKYSKATTQLIDAEIIEINNLR